ncbi:MAG: DNA-binding response regulator [Flavobacteriales bacterium]|nr:MAG: DNA-binding response regulator [Flavobacteriales bacterium]
MKIKILIVEDEVLVAEEIAADLKDYGFEITEIAISSDECFNAIKKEIPNVILMDINIKGEQDGIETANMITKTHNIPIVYLTANTDSKTMERALASSPSAFISKPYTKKDLVIALELAFNKHNEKLITTTTPKNTDSFFVKDGAHYTKINSHEINYIEADGSYSQIITTVKKYTLSTNLNHFQGNLNNPIFVRIHRSYIVNISKVEAFDKNSLTIAEKTLPISKSYQKEIMKFFNKL